MLALTIRLICSLAVVIGLLLLITRLSARKMRGPADSLVKLVERKPLSRTSAISVITVGDRVLVVGTTEHDVRLLTELDATDLESATTVPARVLSLSREVPREPSREGGAHRAGIPVSPPTAPALAGSVLSTQTWRQAFAAATGRVREGA